MKINAAVFLIAIVGASSFGLAQAKEDCEGYLSIANAPVAPIDDAFLAALPPLPAVMPEIGSVLFKGYRFRSGMRVTYQGNLYVLRVKSLKNGGLIKLEHIDGSGRGVLLEADQCLGIPEIKASYDARLESLDLAEQDEAKVNNGNTGKMVMIDRIEMGPLHGRFLRFRTESANSLFLRAVLKQPKLFMRFGIHFDPLNLVLIMPDRTGVIARLNSIRSQYGLVETMAPKEAAGEVSEDQYHSYIEKDNAYPLAHGAHGLVHDLVDHGFSFTLLGESTQVGRSRLAFLTKLKKVILSLPDLSPTARQSLLKLWITFRGRELSLYELQTDLAATRIWHAIESEEAGQGGREYLQLDLTSSLQALGARSAKDVRNEFLAEIDKTSGFIFGRHLQALAEFKASVATIPAGDYKLIEWAKLNAEARKVLVRLTQ